MNYTDHYDRLMARARSRVLTGYKERHHVLPKCIGGGNEPSNLVDLTAEEHYVAHQLLVKIYPTVTGLAAAVLRMAPRLSGNKAFGWLRRRFAERVSATRLGIKLPPFSDAHRKKMSDALKGNKHWSGRKHKPETIIKMSGKHLSAEHKAKISASNRGFPNPQASGPKTPEHRAKIGAAVRAAHARRRSQATQHQVTRNAGA